MLPTADSPCDCFITPWIPAAKDLSDFELCWLEWDNGKRGAVEFYRPTNPSAAPPPMSYTTDPRYLGAVCGYHPIAGEPRPNGWYGCREE